MQNEPCSCAMCGYNERNEAISVKQLKKQIKALRVLQKGGVGFAVGRLLFRSQLLLDCAKKRDPKNIDLDSEIESTIKRLQEQMKYAKKK
jgi:hypothetical protein